MSEFYVSVGVSKIADERRKQLKKWPHPHDDDHDDGVLVCAAVDLAAFGYPNLDLQPVNVWGLLNKRSGSSVEQRIERLTIAGALIAAEIDRLERLEAP